jgi:hypothetical protein
MFPAALVRPGGETRDRRFGDEVERGAFAHMRRSAVEPIKQVRAAATRQRALGPIHGAVQDERVGGPNSSDILTFSGMLVLPIRSNT